MEAKESDLLSLFKDVEGFSQINALKQLNNINQQHHADSFLLSNSVEVRETHCSKTSFFNSVL